MTAIRSSRSRLLTAAATGVLAALSLTACGDGSGVENDGSAHVSSSSSASESDGSGSWAEEGDESAPGGTEPDGGKDSAASGNDGKDGKDGKDGNGTSTVTNGSGAVTCHGSGTRTVAAPVRRPLNHVLLTVTNTGSKTCHLYGYPAVRFGEAQSVPPVIESSKPQAVVTLSPGESGYASITTSAADGTGTHGRTEKSLAVHFQDRSGSWDGLAPAHPALPAKGVHVDDTLKVSYWQQSMDDALTW